MARANHLVFVLLALLACAFRAHAGSTTNIVNSTPCTAVVKVEYASFLCANDNDVNILPGNTFSKGSGACQITNISGNLKDCTTTWPGVQPACPACAAYNGAAYNGMECDETHNSKDDYKIIIHEGEGKTIPYCIIG